ncbi:MAG: DUF1592 domain-containing protein [Proteobacteria bacterium]|nr:MAG: DUF1592 domain-containing protein [Pseudomonadota bacterium]
MLQLKSTILNAFLGLCCIGFISCKSRPDCSQTQDKTAFAKPYQASSCMANQGAQAESFPEYVTDAQGRRLKIATAVPRLSHAQWENSVRDILLLPSAPDPAFVFEADPPGSLFQNNQSILKATPNLVFDYQNAAESLAIMVTSDPVLMQKLLPVSLPSDPKRLAEAVVEPLAVRAYRRPITVSERDELSKLFIAGRTLTGSENSLKAGLQVVIEALLQSPYFLYRLELGGEESGVIVTLDASEIASRLSYAIWNSIPDEELIRLISTRELLNPDVQRQQVLRMMDDPRASNALRFFFAKVLGIEEFQRIGPKDKSLFPIWAPNFGNLLFLESTLFINDVIIGQQKGLNEILTAPYTFANHDTAPLYGLAVEGSQFQKVNLDSSKRAGFLSQLGYLALNSTSDTSDPIHRGVFTALRLSCAQLESPKGNLPPLPPVVGPMTLRERVEAHTGKGTCGSSCHQNVINPAGFAFENFDAAGQWRTLENGRPIDATGELSFPTGKMAFTGPVDFATQLSKKQEVHQCLLKKAVEFLYGRTPDDGDSELINRLSLESLKGMSAKEIFTSLLLDVKIKQRTK